MEDYFLNKTVQIYSGDFYKKEGVVKNVGVGGVTFLITKSHDSAYTVGKLHFIAYSANLSFEEV